MISQDLEATAKALVAPGKGILAADESFGTIEKRFKAINIPSTEENRRAYRDMLFTTPGLGQFISGVILFDETIRQKTADGTPFTEALRSQGIIPGIKVDKGAKPLANFLGERITEGLDGLRERFPEQATPQQVAEATLRCLRQTVPGAVPGIVFLSGGQKDVEATQNLNAINQRGTQPWSLTFSYGRALQDPSLKAWAGDSANIAAG